MPRHAREGRLNVNALDFLHDCREDLLGDVLDILFLDKAHFEVDLREFRLAVCAQILITEASRNLEIFLDAADHEQLLVLLGRLR